MWKKHGFVQTGITLLGILFVAGSFACKPTETTNDVTVTPTDSPSPAPTDPTPPGTVNETAFYLNVLFEEDEQPIDFFLHEQSSFTTKCRVEKEEATLSKRDLYCILDVGELDLYFNPLTLNFNAPTGMCKYVRLDSYYYFNRQPSPAPHTATLDVTYLDGVIVAPDSNNNVWIDTEGTVGCTFDYRATNGPDCCEALVTYNNSYTYSDGVTPSTSSIVTTPYGGKRTNCLDGPAIDEPFSRTADGWPMALYYRAQSSGLNKTWKITAPIEKQKGGNVRVANFYRPSQFGAGADTFPQTQQPTPVVNPYYEISCRDTADDNVARIRLFIRSWDRVDNFTAQSNPYSGVATEPQYGGPYHDRSVWSGIGNSYPNEP